MAVTYDPAVLTKFAEKLYAKASSVVFGYAARGLALGALAGYAFAMVSAAHNSTGFFALVGGLLGTLIGLGIGNDKAFAFRLEAQRTLCQLQTEMNSRKSVAG